MIREYTATGATVEEAIENACRELGYEIYEMDLITVGEEAYASKHQRRRGELPDAGGRG